MMKKSKTKKVTKVPVKKMTVEDVIKKLSKFDKNTEISLMIGNANKEIVEFKEISIDIVEGKHHSDVRVCISNIFGKWFLKKQGYEV
jgi:hypothetical protein